MKICIICSGISEEKGISINSAKSIYEILEYFKKTISQLEVIFMEEGFKFYPLKKEFLFSNTVEDFLYLCDKQQIIENYISYLKSFHMVFLTTHGPVGEDGFLQKLLDENHIKYIGPSYYTAFNTFDKHRALTMIWEENICNSWTSEIFEDFKQVKNLFKTHKKLCIKPNDAGSSIGVNICESYEKAEEAIKNLKSKNYTPLLEEVHEGVEFSVTVIRGIVYEPTEIVNRGIFTYEKKYFPSNQVIYKNPSSFSSTILNKIKNDSKLIYNLFKCKDFIRIDGFLLENKNEVIYTDFNSIPGFQLNGLFFKNKNHFEIMRNILNLPNPTISHKKKKKIFVIFGGDNSEQNVSILTGSNVLFNLTKNTSYDSNPFLLYKNKFWSLRYEESFYTSIEDFKQILKDKKPLSLNSFLLLCKEKNALVFMGLHGGIGENGYLQKVFEKENIVYTGSNSIISSLCMNKFKTNKLVEKNFFKNKHIYLIKFWLKKNFSKVHLEEFKKIFYEFPRLFIKPNDDGCSVGALLLNSYEELIEYQQAIINKMNYFKGIPMSIRSKDYLISEYIPVDKIRTVERNIQYLPLSHWIECTVGVLGNIILPASVCVTNNNMLTMEEKFLHGTGTNLTPIPLQVMEFSNRKIIYEVIKQCVEIFKLTTYCRIDFFYNIKTQQVAIIEINTLPALTPATVLFQQAIQYNITPKLLINKIIKLSKKNKY
jgi:D-alanine--D-alanine ligase